MTVAEREMIEGKFNAWVLTKDSTRSDIREAFFSGYLANKKQENQARRCPSCGNPCICGIIT